MRRRYVDIELDSSVIHTTFLAISLGYQLFAVTRARHGKCVIFKLIISILSNFEIDFILLIITFLCNLHLAAILRKLSDEKVLKTSDNIFLSLYVLGRGFYDL